MKATRKRRKMKAKKKANKKINEQNHVKIKQIKNIEDLEEIFDIFGDENKEELTDELIEKLCKQEGWKDQKETLIKMKEDGGQWDSKRQSIIFPSKSF